MKKLLYILLPIIMLAMACKKENNTPAQVVIDYRDSIAGTYSGKYYNNSNFNGPHWTNTTLTVALDSTDSSKIIMDDTPFMDKLKVGLKTDYTFTEYLVNGTFRNDSLIFVYDDPLTLGANPCYFYLKRQ